VSSPTTPARAATEGADAAEAVAYLPEDVFKSQIVITKTRLPLRYPSVSAFVDTLRSSMTNQIWRTNRSGDPWGKWEIEYVAFFADPLVQEEIWVRFYSLADGGRREVAGDRQYVHERGSRIFGSSIELSEPEFAGTNPYEMTIEVAGRVLASTKLWLVGK
jgi:hypothetical protein